jgi:S-layer protein
LNDYFATKGLTPLTHFLKFGEDEGLTAPEVPADKQVDPDPGPTTPGETFTLTAGVDKGAAFTGGAGNDTFEADYDIAAGVHTLGGLDDLDGGDGTDTLDITDQSSGGFTLAGATVENIENITIQGADSVTADVSGSTFTGVKSLASTKSTTATLTAGDTTDVAVSGATGAIDVAGGKDVTVTDSTADVAINIGESGAGTTNAAGIITLTDTDQGTGAVVIDGGTDVTATTTVTTGTLNIGSNAAASGSVTVAATADERADNDDLTMGAISVTGGASVDVTVSAGSTDATEFATGTTITQSDVTVTGDDSTTEVSIKQDAAVAEETYTAAVEGVAQTKTVKFVAMAANETVTVDGLVFTAAKSLTASEVAQAFANLSKSDTQTEGGPTANGIFTNNISANWTSGAADGDTVTFTEVTPATADTALVVADTAAAGNVAVTPVVTGKTAVTGNDGVLGVTGGAAVVVDQGGAAATIETITLDGYGAGSDINFADALTTLNLANSAEGLAVDAAVETLDLTLDNVTGASVIDLDDSLAADNDSIETLNVSMLSDSDADIIADAATTLNVSGEGDLTTTSTATAFAALETVVVTGAAGLVLTGTDTTVLETIDASATTGDVTASIDTGVADAASIATAYKGGSGADNVTLVADTAVDAGIDLGAGDDKLTLTASTTAITGTVAAGEGTDIISMDTTSAENLDDEELNATGFEKLELTAADGGESIDAATMGFNYVIVDGGVADDGGAPNVVEDFELILDSGSTLELDGDIGDAGTTADTLTLTVNDAATGTADIVSVVAQAANGILVADDVETINIDAAAGDSTFGLTADSVESLVITGEEFINLSDAAGYAGAAADYTSVTTGNISNSGDSLTLIDASAMTDGGLVAVADGGVAQEILGGAGDDILVAAGSGDILNGGAGDDILVGANLTQLTGGAGADMFVMNTPTNVNSYATILDLEAGDTIQFTATSKFVSSAIELGDTAVFQDFANATVKELDDNANDVAWFEFSGNTYIIESGDDAADDFVGGTDSIIKIAGVVDLSTASYNMTDGTLEIA